MASRITTLAERSISSQVGEGTPFAEKLIEAYRAGIFNYDQAFALARCVKYREQIADVSIGQVWREELDAMCKEAR